MREVLKQPRFHPFTLSAMVLSFIVLESGILDAVDTASAGKVCMKILNRTLSEHAELVNKIDQEGRLTDKDIEMLINSIAAVEI